jgi:glycerol-3-phosphate dehydrogenase
VAEGSPLLVAQVVYAIDNELARTPEDVLRRRTPLALRRGRGLRELEAVAQLMDERLAAGPERRKRWLDDYTDHYSAP